MNTDSNTSRPTATTPSKSSTSLKYLAYGIYLQLFIGIGMLAMGFSGVKSELLNNSSTSGLILIGLGVNSLIYVQRYKRSLR